jgi:hypothetical protein
VSRSAAALLLAAAAALGGCGLNTTTKNGKVGDELSAGGLHVTVSKVDLHPPQPERDITGLGTPAGGMRFFGVKARVCNDRGNAIGTSAFSMKVDGGDAHVRFPQSVYSRGYDDVRSGCGGGWIVFEAADDTTPRSVSFRYDDTGSAQPSGKPEKHARFKWSL